MCREKQLFSYDTGGNVNEDSRKEGDVPMCAKVIKAYALWHFQEFFYKYPHTGVMHFWR